MRNRGAALWGNLVITGAGIAPPRIIATDKETGKVVWETSFPDTPDVTFTSAPLAIKDKIIVGAANGDQGVRDWIGALDAATGKLVWRKFTIPAPGEPGSETWKDNHNAWQTGGGAVWVTGTYDPDTNQTIWGTGNPVPMFDPTYRPGDNLYTNSAISWDPDTGKMNWYFQFTPGDMWDYDEVGTHILIDGVVAGQPRKLITHSARNGFLYTMERGNGQMVLAKPYMDVNWTKGIDQKTGKPLDYDPTKDIQTYAGVGNFDPGEPLKKVCPSQAGGNNYWPSSYSPQDQAALHPGALELRDRHDRPREAQQGERLERRRLPDRRPLRKQPDRRRSRDRRDQEDRAPALPELLRHARDRGGLVFIALLDGTVAAYDDTTLDELWKINVGSGFSAPPMTFEVNGKQYVAIVSGPSPVSRAPARQHAGAARSSATRSCSTCSGCEHVPAPYLRGMGRAARNRCVAAWAADGVSLRSTKPRTPTLPSRETCAGRRLESNRKITARGHSMITNNINRLRSAQRCWAAAARAAVGPRSPPRSRRSG